MIGKLEGFEYRQIKIKQYIILYLSFVYPPLGGYGGILPEVVIFPEGDSPKEISPLRLIFHRIPRAEGL